MRLILPPGRVSIESPVLQPMAARWSTAHLQLHQLLLRQPSLLPKATPLLLAVSGGQDSMAMTALLQDLQRLHKWPLLLWHGDHGLRAESAEQAEALGVWAAEQGLPIEIEPWQEPQPNEAAARRWRYGCLKRLAHEQKIAHLLTAHTATDKAETVILQAARGSHLRGLGSLRPRRPFAADIELVRPMLGFSREDTGRICRELELPVWLDSSNSDPCFSRNRVRHEVLPVLERLHPGATRRLATLSESLAQESNQQSELIHLALQQLMTAGRADQLNREMLQTLHPANQGKVLQAWLEHQGKDPLAAESLQRLIQRLPVIEGPGQWDLAGGAQLSWNRKWIRLQINP